MSQIIFFSSKYCGLRTKWIFKNAYTCIYILLNAEIKVAPIPRE